METERQEELMATASNPTIAARKCAFCGKPMRAELTRCPHCREEVPDVRLTKREGKDGRQEVRRGLLYMLMGAVIHYFAAGYSALKMPDILNSVLVVYFSELVFLAGLGMFLYGWYLRLRS
jgi:hypothetical protein